ncbi:hypothetical protein HDV57DRAFT_373664 [Trichoderma longibrachiatum]
MLELDQYHGSSTFLYGLSIREAAASRCQQLALPSSPEHAYPSYTRALAVRGITSRERSSCLHSFTNAPTFVRESTVSLLLRYAALPFSQPLLRSRGSYIALCSFFSFWRWYSCESYMGVACGWMILDLLPACPCFYVSRHCHTTTPTISTPMAISLPPGKIVQTNEPGISLNVDLVRCV